MSEMRICRVVDYPVILPGCIQATLRVPLPISSEDYRILRAGVQSIMDMLEMALTNDAPYETAEAILARVRGDKTTEEET